MADRKRKAPEPLLQKTKEQSRKRQRRGGRIQLLDLSDEILLRTLSFLGVSDLIACERVCSKLGGLASDNGLWKERYYQRFMRPRVRRAPGLRSSLDRNQTTRTGHKRQDIARFIRSEQPAVESRALEDWKLLFKIKHNWTSGRARRSELPVASDPRQYVHAKVSGGRLFTVDLQSGLRVWKAGIVTCQYAIDSMHEPTAMAVEVSEKGTHICIGSNAGNMRIFRYNQKDENILAIAECRSSSGQSVTNIALSWPYLMTIDSRQNVNLQHFKLQSGFHSARLLTTLHSEAILSPVALSLRMVKGTLVAGIAYTFSSLQEGWCLGVQEVRMPLTDPQNVEASQSVPNTDSEDSVATQVADVHFTTRFATSSAFALHPDLRRAPSSVSYCGCYVMVGLPDNTLMVYLVRSTDATLAIESGRRLWGHTSAISAAEVTPTGKAVSISAYSDEMRYWELEEVLSSSSQSKSSTSIRAIQPVNKDGLSRGNGLDLAFKEVKKEFSVYRHGVSFDHEQAIVLGRSDQGQVISCFNFA